MSESKFQNKIINKYKKSGWYVIRLLQTTTNGIPDLICLKENHKPRFIEVKGEFGKVSELQKYRIKELKDFGFDAGVMFENKNKIIVPE